MKTLVPNDYKSSLDILMTQVAIKQLKNFFETELAKKLNLTRVSAPLFVNTNSGLNDDLSGKERSVKFDYCAGEAEIVHSLAKWKREALKRYNFGINTGIYTDMNAIRRDEEFDNIHSMYVDQWDWEKCIEKSERNEDYLKKIVNDIFDVFKSTESYINGLYPVLKYKLPDEIFFITSQELEEMYPDKSSKDREHLIAREKKAVFISKIGKVLNSGNKHDDRSADYDDWELNGDILFYNSVLDKSIELSSMGIRVDENSLMYQLEKLNQTYKLKYDYHKKILNSELPYTVGGGIGQSRICMFFLEKCHIGEVQASLWDEETIEVCENNGIKLL